MKTSKSGSVSRASVKRYYRRLATEYICAISRGRHTDCYRERPVAFGTIANAHFRLCVKNDKRFSEAYKRALCALSLELERTC